MEARTLKWAWWIRALFAGVALFLPLGHPHVWRQMDTLGVTLRYWLRWTVEPTVAFPLLPAVLQSGDTSGIMAMEWPLLNLLFAPLYQFGPAAGTALARGLLFALNMGLLLLVLRIWRKVKLVGIDARRSFRWMPLMGLGLVFLPKFIPDASAMLLVLAGTGLWQTRRRRWLAGGLCALGLLMKPTSVIVLGLLLLTPARILFALPALLPGLALTGLYYLKGMDWIQLVSGNESFYRVTPQNPWHSLLAFLGEGRQLFDLFLQGLSFYAGLPLLLALQLLLPQRFWRLWGLLLLQILAIALLDGTHSYQHRYYFMGTLPVLCLLLQGAWDALPSLRWGRWARGLVGLLLTASALTHLAYEWRPFYIPTPPDRFLSFRDCAELKAQLPQWPWHQSAVFRTHPRQYPLVGLCFGEREGSQLSPYGLFVVGDPMPPGCQVVAKAGAVLGAHCGTAL